ncbi:Putative transposase [Micrococcus luteus]|nr:Putative transposase [Micrococcus luteus]
MRPRGTLCSRRCAGSFRAVPHRTGGTRRAAVARAANTALAAAPSYARHVPERTLLYALVQAHYPDFIVRLEAEDRSLPEYVREEFETYLRCGVLEHGFLRVVCEQCRAERLVAYSCKKRGFCPSCGARRMAESARHLVEEVFGPRPVRQWVLSFPYPLRFLFASKPEAIGPVLGIVHRVIAGWLADQAGVPRDTAQCGAVTLIQRFGSALNLNIHFHMLWLDGVYEDTTERPQRKPRLHPHPCAHIGATDGTGQHHRASRVCRHLSRRGWLEGEDESVFLSDSAGSDDGMDGLRMSSMTYRIATVATLAARPSRCKHCPVTQARWRATPARSAASRCMPAWPQKHTKATSSKSCAATSRARRSASSGCRSHRRVGCGISSRRRGAMAPRMSNGMRWTSSPSWRHWSRRHARISPASTAYSPRTRICARR